MRFCVIYEVGERTENKTCLGVSSGLAAGMRRSAGADSAVGVITHKQQAANINIICRLETTLKFCCLCKKYGASVSGFQVFLDVFVSS